MSDDRPVGEPLNWAPREPPDRSPLTGTHVSLRPIDAAADAEHLFAASNGHPAIWTYMPYGPFEGVEDMRQMLTWAASSEDPVFFAIVGRADERPLGMCSYLRITPSFGVIEIGHIWFGPRLQRTTGATEAIFLLAAHAFDQLGYRRLEWKCDSLNAASRHAAERFGFSFEGVFRKHQVVKGRNRDTAWYAITNDQWPAIRSGFQRWLAAENFEAGAQRRPLAELIAEAR